MWVIATLALVYVALVVIASLPGRSNPWGTTWADILFWYPAEIAFAGLGWVITNSPLVAAFLMVAALVWLPVLIIVWALW